MNAKLLLKNWLAGVIAAATIATFGAAATPPGPEEQQRLALERFYQQELAKKRAEEAKERAAFEEQIQNLSAEERYERLLGRAARFLASADFQAGIRTYNQAMTTKPADMPVTEQALELQRALQAQNRAVDVTLVSDGETSVSIRYYRAPMKLQSTTIKMLPGNYEVRGQRVGYREVVVTLQVRADAPQPLVTITCTQPAQ